jgi:uncharacterized membrane protein
MIGDALIVTIAIFLALVVWLMGELKFLIPYRSVLYHQYAGVLLLWLAIAFANVFAAVYALERKFLLKDTGRKLSHIDKQALTGQLSVPHPRVEKEI